MRRNVAAGIGSKEQGEYCRAALQRSDRKEPRYKWPTLLYFYFYFISLCNALHACTDTRPDEVTLSHSLRERESPYTVYS